MEQPFAHIFEKGTCVLNGHQFAEWDRYTLENERLESIDLMEQACVSFTSAFKHEFPNIQQPITIIAGPGNNGGDALGIARNLIYNDYSAIQLICINPESQSVSIDYEINFNRLPKVSSLQIIYWEDFSTTLINEGSILIDGLLGTGFKSPIREDMFGRINLLNKLPWKKVIAIDIPSGLGADEVRFNGAVLSADITFTFGLLKKAFLWSENEKYTGRVQVLKIGLSDHYRVETKEYFLNEQSISALLHQKKQFGHKYTFGKAQLIVGSKKYPGAAVLAAKGCYSVGAGLVSVTYTDNIVLNWLAQMPEVIPTAITQKIDLTKTKAVLFGSGIDSVEWDTMSLSGLIEAGKEIPWVIDGNGLLLLEQRHISFPKLIIWTPHEGEFDQYTGDTTNTSDKRLEKAKSCAIRLRITIVLKGKYTKIILPDGTVLFNPTGNSALAKAGTGDVLAGMITGLLAQGYSSELAALIGVYIHGLSADILCKHRYHRSIMASEVAFGVSDAFLHLTKKS